MVATGCPASMWFSRPTVCVDSRRSTTPALSGRSKVSSCASCRSNVSSPASGPPAGRKMRPAFPRLRPPACRRRGPRTPRVFRREGQLIPIEPFEPEVQILGRDRRALEDRRTEADDQKPDATLTQRHEQRALSGRECEVVHDRAPAEGAVPVSAPDNGAHGRHPPRPLSAPQQRWRARAARAVRNARPTHAVRETTPRAPEWPVYPRRHYTEVIGAGVSPRRRGLAQRLLCATLPEEPPRIEALIAVQVAADEPGRFPAAADRADHPRG
jgi:hypothetical protein